MKKNKFKLFLMSMFFVFSAGILCSCGESNIEIAFNSVDYTMAINQEIDLEELVTISGGKLDDIVFSSSNENVVYVTPSNKLVSRNEGEAIISAKNYDATITISVKGVDINFSAPKNISYDETTNRIKWDAVYAGNKVANTYTLLISKNNGNFEEYQVNKNYFTIEGNGNYKIKIASNERDGIKASQFSEEYSFIKLTAPTNLQYNDTTKTLTWESDNSVANFYVKINGVLSEKISGKQYNINLENSGNYEISVLSCADSGENVFGSTCENPLTLTRLAPVDITVGSGVVTWEDNQENAKKYKVEVFNEQNENAIHTEYINKNGAGKYTYTLNNISQVNSKYTIRVTAIGDVEESLNTFDYNSHYLNSAEAKYEGIVKLDKAIITFNKESQTISIYNYNSSKKYNLYVKYNQEQAQLIEMTNESETLDFNNAGTYEIFVVNCAVNEDYEINSENSNIITVVKLEQANDISQKVDSNGNYIVEGINVANATNYLLQATHVSTQQTSTLVDYSNGLYGKTDEIFQNQGDYKVKIIASGTDVGSSIYYLNSETTLDVHRLQDCALVDNGSKIQWSKDNSFVNVVYSYKLHGEMDEPVISTQTEFIYSNLEKVGEYTLEVYETTQTIEGQKVLILDSLNKEKINFTIERQIEAPLTILTKEETSEKTSYYLNVELRENADSYSIYCNDDIINVINNPEENIKLDITDYFNTEGKGTNLQHYTFKVAAKSETNKYYTESEQAVVEVQKANVPTTFTLDINENIIANSTEQWYESTKIIVDGKESNLLTELKTEYEVEIKFIAKSSIVDGVYYIDSDYAKFTLNRDNTEVGVKNNTIQWSTSDNSIELVKILTITQGANSTNIQFNSEETEIKIEDLASKINSFVFNEEESFTAAIKYSLGQKTFNISGEYVDGVFVSSDTNEYYISSKLATINVNYPSEELNLAVSEEENAVIISWNSEENLNFVAYIDNSYTSELISSTSGQYTYEFDKEKFETVATYNITLEKVSDAAKIVYLFSITKLGEVSNVTIDKEEKLLSTTAIGSEKVVFEYNGEEITSLSEVTGDNRTIIAYNKAQNSENVYAYYINGDSQEFNFSRLQPTEIVFENNIMKWTSFEDEQSANFNYVLRFFDDNVDTTDKIQTLSSSTTSINLNDSTYQNIIKKLKGNKYVAIQKVVSLYGNSDSYEISKTQTNYLSSVESDAVQLKVLNNPTNIKFIILDENKTQNQIKIIWDIEEISGTTINSYNIKISNGKTEVVVSSAVKEFTIKEEDPYFDATGEWSVSVQAVGTNGSLNSEYSERVVITRLESSNLLNISNSGLITWTKNINADSYLLEYSYVNADGLVQKNTTIENSEVNSYQLPEEVLNDTFSGEINVSLYTLGDGTNYLSNNKQAIFNRLVSPEITLTEEYMVIDNYGDYISGTEININVSIENAEIINQNIIPTKLNDGRYVWYYPIDNLEINKDILIRAYATKSTGNYLDSNNNNGTVVMLDKISNLRVYKDADGTIYLCADNSNPVTKYTINIAGEDVTGAGEDIKITITDDMLAKMSEDWTITANAIGEASANKVYISGQSATISGKKLTKVSGIKTVDGKIVWDAVEGVSKFIMNIDGTVLDKTYSPTSRVETLTGDGFAATSHNIKVRAIGNLGTEAISSNIILDGDYSDIAIISKLETLTNVNIINGYFSFDSIANANEYIAYVYRHSDVNSFIGEYSLTTISLPIEDSLNYYINDELINVLTKTVLSNSEEIRVKFYAKTNLENYVYSDYAKISVNENDDEYLTLRVLKNASDKMAISHPNIIGKEETDYSITYASWKNSTDVADSNYLISINDETQVINNGTTEITLDADGSWVAGAQYIIKYKQFGSTGISADRVAYLTPEYSQSIIVEKLHDVEINLYLKTESPYGLMVRFTNVKKADKYYCYLDNKLFAEHNSAISYMDLSSLDAGEYKNFKVKAICTAEGGNITYIASNDVVPYVLSGEEYVPVETFKKISAPKLATTANGSMYWTLTNEDLFSMIFMGAFVEDPIFVNGNILNEERIELLFTSSNNVEYKFVDNLYKYIYISDEQINYLKEQLKPYETMLGDEYQILIDYIESLREEQQLGFPSLNYTFSEFASTLPSGEYSVQVRVIGEVVFIMGETAMALFSSEFSEKDTKYISMAPTIIAQNLKQGEDDIIGNYYIKFNNIQVDSKYFGESQGYPKYNLVAVYEDENGEEQREILATLAATSINDSAEMKFDLTALINDGVLTSKHKSLYLFVSGNDTNILNGRLSNSIAVTVLEDVEARVDHGVIKWNSQDSASKYIIDYGTGIKVLNKDALINENAITYYEWLCEELSAEVTEGYDVKITAYGSPLNTESKNEIIISGPNTSIGKIVKLPMITNEINGVDIVNGLYTWNKIENATGYDVFVGNELDVLPDNYNTIYAINFDNIITYETTAEKVSNKIINYYYYFRTVGTENGTLTENGLTYVNSVITEYNSGKRLNEIPQSDLKMIDGIISWNPGNNLNSFKLVFNYIEESGTVGQEIPVYVSYDEVATGNGTCTFDTNTLDVLKKYGNYSLKIQSYRGSKTAVAGEDIDTYYLISETAPISFYKLRSVENIVVDNGLVEWEYKDIDNINAKHYYKLVFTYEDKTSIKYSDSESFSDIVFDDELMAEKPLKLKIYVVPGEKPEEVSNLNYAISYSTEYGASIYQYATIDESTIKVSVTDAGQIKIDWEGPDDKEAYDPDIDGTFKYQIYYYVKGNLASAKTYDIENRSQVLCGYGEGADIAFNIQSDASIGFKIRRIPMSENYISSAWTEEKEISQPASITNIRLEDYTVVWDKFETTTESSYQYKIKDEFETVEIVDGEEVVKTNVYVFTANIGDESYTPFIVGKHKVSVAVVNLSSDLISSYVELEQEVDFNIFTSGDGTTTNPYIISNATEFNNMKYRLSKDVKLNSYYAGEIIGDKLEIDEVVGKVELVGDDTKFNFEQNEHLTISRKEALTGLNLNENYDFNGIYNGKSYSINFELFNTEGLDTYYKTYVSLFDKIGNEGVVKNIHLLVNLEGTVGKITTISALCYENNGKISNVVIGDIQDVKADRTTLQLSNIKKDIDFTFIAYNNNATIELVQNYYNINFATNEKNAYSIQYAPISIINNCTISQVKNLGDINISAGTINVAGIVATLNANATLIESANVGNFKLYYNINGASESHVGGLIAKNTNGIITSCYSVCDITITYNTTEFVNTTPDVYAGGLIGYSTGDNITQSYTNVTKNINTTSGLSNIYQVIGMLYSATSGTNVYYKNQGVEFSAYAGTNNVAEGEYFVYDTLDVNDLSDKFSSVLADGDNGNPHLKWEDEFKLLEWIELD